MDLRTIFSLSAIAALGLSLSGAAHAQTAKDLVGTWDFVSSVTTAPDGTKSVPKGPHAIGRFIFDANGHVAFIKLNPDVPKFAANNAAQGTPEENKAVVIGSEAYIGTYTLAGNILTNKIEGSSYPNWTGTDQQLTIVSLTKDQLEYSVTASKGGQVNSFWKRIN